MYVESRTAEPGSSEEPDEGSALALAQAVLRRFSSLQLGIHHKSRGERRAVRMVPDTLVTDGRRMRYSVSNNVNAHGPEGPGSPPIWAVNVHGYFAGGTMYWRESANLAEKLGWRVLNPTLPGFAGSDPLPWQRVTIEEIADQVVNLLDAVGVERAVILGHSMGGAVAVRVASARPDRVLGIIYRDGAATPEWKNRHGAVMALLSPILPEAANLVDLTLSVMMDSPDLLIGRRLQSTMRGLWPDAQLNLRAFGKVLPIGSMLMALDMTDEVAQLADHGIPVLAEWGCFDRVVTARCAEEFCELAQCSVVWVPGGHSWMLPRPRGQSDILRHLPAGREFLDRVVERRGVLASGSSGSAGSAAGVGAVDPIDIFRNSTAG